MRSASPAEHGASRGYRSGHHGSRRGVVVSPGHDDVRDEIAGEACHAARTEAGDVLHTDRGSVTAEFATVIPAVLLVLACCLGGVQLVSQQLRLQDAAAAASRSLARGDDLGTASARVARLVGKASLERDDRGGMVCVRLAAPAPAGVFAAVRVEAASCALAMGE